MIYSKNIKALNVLGYTIIDDMYTTEEILQIGNPFKKQRYKEISF